MAKLLSRKNYPVDNMPYSPMNFFSLLQKVISEQGFSCVRVGEVGKNYHGKGASGKRVYLRIHHRKHYIDIGAIPNGSDFYISIALFERNGTEKALENFEGMYRWLGKQSKSIKGGANAGAWIVRKFRNRIEKRKQDLYRQDEVSIFYQSINNIVLEVVKLITKQKGQRRI